MMARRLGLAVPLLVLLSACDALTAAELTVKHIKRQVCISNGRVVHMMCFATSAPAESAVLDRRAHLVRANSDCERLHNSRRLGRQLASCERHVQISLETSLAKVEERYAFGSKPDTAVVCMPGHHSDQAVSLVFKAPGSNEALPDNEADSQSTKPGVDAACFAVKMGSKCAPSSPALLAPKSIALCTA